MNRAKELIRLAERVGLSLTPENGKLVVRGDKSLEWIVEQLREYREEIISIISHPRAGNYSESNSLATDTDTTQRIPGKTEVVSTATFCTPSNVRDNATPWTDEDDRLMAFVLALTPADLPQSPFWLHPWAEVLDSERYLVWLKRDVAMGPTSPRARYGVLLGDMERLREIVMQHRKETPR